MIIKKLLMALAPAFVLLAFPELAMAVETMAEPMDMTSHWVGFVSIAIFVVAYLLVMAEEFTHLRKSKPVILAAGLSA